MVLQEGEIELLEPGELGSDQVAFLSDVCKEFISDRLGSKIDKQEHIDSSEAEQIVESELPGYLRTLCTSSTHPTKMVYPVCDATRIIASRRSRVVSIFMEAYRAVKIGMMRSDVVEQVASVRFF